jgi:hypothetical protein
MLVFFIEMLVKFLWSLLTHNGSWVSDMRINILPLIDAAEFQKYNLHIPHLIKWLTN